MISGGEKTTLGIQVMCRNNTVNQQDRFALCGKSAQDLEKRTKEILKNPFCSVSRGAEKDPVFVEYVCWGEPKNGWQILRSPKNNNRTLVPPSLRDIAQMLRVKVSGDATTYNLSDPSGYHGVSGLLSGASVYNLTRGNPHSLDNVLCTIMMTTRQFIRHGSEKTASECKWQCQGMTR